MDRRRETRITANDPVILTILGDPQPRLISATAADLTGRGMRVRSPTPVPIGCPIKAETPDAMFLGEVCHCAPDGDAYSIGLDLDQALTGLLDLARLNRTLLEHDAPEILYSSR